MHPTQRSIGLLLTCLALSGCRSELDKNGHSGTSSTPIPEETDLDRDGFSPGEGDCDDEDPEVYPGAASNEPLLCTRDADGDGYGDAQALAPVNAGTDCDDSDSELNPEDNDEDGYSSCEGDCDDLREWVNPEATDGLLADRNCDGVVSDSGGPLDSGGSLRLADYELRGEDEGDYAGTTSSAGDVDGDGLDDVLVGAWGRGSDGGGPTGSAYVILGSSLGTSKTIDLSSADYKFEGPSSGDCLGFRVSGAGDVDGDGLDDLLLGALGDDEGGAEAGAAYVILGSSLGATRTIDLSDADYKLVGEKETDFAGMYLSGAGDVDGDGLDDLLVGALGDDEGGNLAGAVYVILGSSLASSRTIDLSDADYKLVGESALDQVGLASSAGDLDGDGLGDVVVGRELNFGVEVIGSAYVVLGSSLGTSRTIDLADADYKLVGEHEIDFAGYAVAGPADVDGDGLSDLLVGAQGNNAGGDYAGAAYVVLGSSLGTSQTVKLSDADYKLVGEFTGDYAGWLVASAGDVDADGRDDVLVGASGHGQNEGAAYLMLGSSFGTSKTIDLYNADYKLLGEYSGDHASFVAGAGDVNGDGRSDVLVGAPGNNRNGRGAGTTYVILTGG